MNFIPGAIAGLTSAILGYPFDTIKTRMQVNNYGNSKNIFFNTVKNEGFISLYRGISAPLITTTFKRSYQYYLFEEMKKRQLNPYISGGIAGISGSIIGCPMHVLKSQMQSTTKIENKNTINLIKKIYRNEGLTGFYRGFYINLFKDMLFGGFYLGNYTYLKIYLPKIIHQNSYDNISEDQRKIIHFLSGGISSVFTWFIFIPIDHFETAIQTKRGVKYVFDKVNNNNIKILWRGSIPILLRIFPVSAFSMLSYEMTLSFINIHN